MPPLPAAEPAASVDVVPAAELPPLPAVVAGGVGAAFPAVVAPAAPAVLPAGAGVVDPPVPAAGAGLSGFGCEPLSLPHAAAASVSPMNNSHVRQTRANPESTCITQLLRWRECVTTAYAKTCREPDINPNGPGVR